MGNQLKEAYAEHFDEKQWARIYESRGHTSRVVHFMMGARVPFHCYTFIVTIFFRFKSARERARAPADVICTIFVTRRACLRNRVGARRASSVAGG